MICEFICSILRILPTPGDAIFLAGKGDWVVSGGPDATWCPVSNRCAAPPVAGSQGL